MEKRIGLWFLVLLLFGAGGATERSRSSSVEECNADATDQEQDHRQRKKRTHASMSLHPSTDLRLIQIVQCLLAFFLSCTVRRFQGHTLAGIYTYIHTRRQSSKQYMYPLLFYIPLHPKLTPLQMSTRRDGWCSRSNSASKKQICVVILGVG